MSLSRGSRWNPGRGNYVNHLSSGDDYGQQGGWLTRVRNELQPDDSTTVPYTPLDPGSTSGSLSDGGIGTLDYETTQDTYNTGQLADVNNPDQVMAGVAADQHERYIRNFRDFENALIAARDDTSLIDAVREDVPEQSQIAREVARRQRSRYGLQQTAVEARESARASQRGEAISLAGGLNNARIAQREANTRLLSDLINIGQGVNRSSLSQLGTAGENAVARRNAYRQARAGHKAQTAQMVGSMGAMLAAFLI